MEKYLKTLLVCLCVLLAYGCSSKDESSSIITIDKKELLFDSNGGELSIVINSSSNWVVTGETDWCQVSPKEGSTVSVITLLNENATDRKTILSFKSGDATAEILVMQYAETNTNYVDLNLGDDGVITEYNENSGDLTVQYKKSVPKNIPVGSAIVLPIEYGFDIRVITNVNSINNKLTLQTKQGNMANIFKNIDFILTTDPSLSATSRSGNKSRVILPSEIGFWTEKGYVKIYDKNNTEMRADISKAFDLFTMQEDYSGTDLYKKGNNHLYWEKCSYDIGLRGVFYFNFGEKQLEKAKVGDLKEFSFYLNGDFNADLLLKFAYTTGVKEEIDEIIKHDVIKTLNFVFTVGNVPIPISVHTHLGNKSEFYADAEVTLSSGFKVNANVKMGMDYIKGKDTTPIKSFTPSFFIHEPTFTAMGSLFGKISYFPRMEFMIYKFIGPWIEPMPYIKEDFSAGMRWTTSGDNYLGWKSLLNAGFDLRMGLKLDFGMFKTEVWKSNVYNLHDSNLFDAPNKIELVSPENGIELEKGKEVVVTFRTDSYNRLNKTYYPCTGVVVNFSTGGQLDRIFAVTNIRGIASVNWIPKDQNDILVATVVDKDGKTISETKFSPKIKGEDDPDDEVELTQGTTVDLGLSVRWASCNLGAGEPQQYGAYFPYDDSMNNSCSAYLKDGLRLPTKTEMEELVNKCECKWTSYKGVEGILVTGTNKNKIFLPAAGYYINVVYQYQGNEGIYWSQTVGKDYNGIKGAYTLEFSKWHPVLSVGFDQGPLADPGHYNMFHTIRPVK